MTKTQAIQQLRKLVTEHCNRDCGSGVKFSQHYSGCCYRLAVLELRELKPFAGSLYPAKKAA